MRNKLDHRSARSINMHFKLIVNLNYRFIFICSTF